MQVKTSLKVLCEKVQMTRQNYYKGHRQHTEQQVDAGLIVQLVKREREQQPRLGGKKLYVLLHEALASEGIRLGRDKFLKVLSDNDLCVDPLPKAPRTTDSRHCLPVYSNLLAEMELTGPNQAVVSDITFIRTAEGYLYLSLITDAFSRKIVGFHAGETLEAKESLKALWKAIGVVPLDSKPIHHSDRGSQYCSHLYTKALIAQGWGISMTEVLHCYENAKAERVNGILKQEYYLGNTFNTKEQAKEAIKSAVHLYNTRRPHTALKYKTPDAVHNLAM